MGLLKKLESFHFMFWHEVVLGVLCTEINQQTIC